MQYKVGTADFTNNSNTVTGHGTLWVGNVAVGDAINKRGEAAVYDVLAVNSDTSITISPAYAGTTSLDTYYNATAFGLSPNLGLYEPSGGDVDWPFLLASRTIRKIDTAVGQLSLGGGTGTGDGVMEAANASAETALRDGGFNGFIIRLDLLDVLPSSETVPPVVTSFTIPTTSNSLTVPINTFYATDAVGVTGFKITESSSKPSSAASGWTVSAPTTFTATSMGYVTLYAWAKDAAGNVSNSLSAAITITLADAVAPTVTAFDLPATSNSLTVSVTTFNSSDNVSVTRWLITESSTTPSLSDPNWVTAKPQQFTFSSIGAKTAYAWVRDAAGNISASLSDTCTIASTDVTKPTVNSFTLYSTSLTSRTVEVTAFTASDDVEVAGYIITESNVTPSAGAAGWTPTPPGLYTFSAVGSITAYPWVKDTTGNVSLSYGAPVSVTITTSANPVTSLAATSGVYQQSVITFTNSATDPTHSPAVSYNLRWRLSSDGIDTTITGITSPYTKTGLANGLTYNFAVDAINAVGAATSTSAVTATTMTTPIAPTITSVTSSSSLNTIDMGTVSGATSYNLYWTTDGGLTADQIVSGGTKHTSPADPYPHTGLVNGTTYRYVQTAVNAVGEGPPSAIVSGTPSVADTTPDAFTFTDQTGVVTSSTIESNAITVSGINSAATISITGGTYAISTNGGSSYSAWTSSSGNVNVNNLVKVRHTSSASNSTATNTTLTIGGVSDTFTTTTEAASTGAVLFGARGTESTGAMGHGVAYPAGIGAGDLLLFAQHYSDGNVPAGWTALDNDGNMGQLVAYKVATGSESGLLYVNGGDDGSGEDLNVNSACMWRLRGNSASTPIYSASALGLEGGFGITTLTGSTFTNVPTGSMLVFLAFSGNNYTISAPTGGIDTLDTSSSVKFHMGYAEDVSGSTVAPSVTIPNGIAFNKISIVVKP